MTSAEYYREWRKAHPEYRQRETQRKRRRVARMTPEERRKDRGGQTHHARLCDPVAVIPPLHQGHELFDRAKSLARITNGFKHLTHPFYDDLISELVVGLLEGDPEAAQKAFLRRERAWLYRTISLTAWREGGPFEDPVAQ